MLSSVNTVAAALILDKQGKLAGAMMVIIHGSGATNTAAQLLCSINAVAGAHSLFTSKVSQQRNGHDGLAEAHFISQDAVEATCVNGHEPVQANVLILSQPMLQQEWHLQRTVTLACAYTSCSHN